MLSLDIELHDVSELGQEVFPRILPGLAQMVPEVGICLLDTRELQLRVCDYRALGRQKRLRHGVEAVQRVILVRLSHLSGVIGG